MKLALIHDWLNQVGGAEDVLAALVRLYPGAPIFTSIYDRERMPEAWRAWPIRTLWVDRLPGIYAHHQRYLPFYPLAFGGLRLRGYDVVLSNKSGFCHGVQVPRGTPHVCYCLAPTRYVWQFEAYAQRENLSAGMQAALRPVLRALRAWDYAAAQRVTRFIAISTEIQTRIRTFYNRDSTILYPPVETDRFVPIMQTADRFEYFLVVSRLIPYKRIDLAVRACTARGLPLVVAGRGRDLDSLRAIAGPTVTFAGYVPDAELPDLIARCRAFLFPGLEDFGIAPVQAMAAGRPVIAYRGGGALDYVLPGKTGEFFDEQTVESLSEVLGRFEARAYDPAAIRAHAQQFDTRVFNAGITQAVEEAVARR